MKIIWKKYENRDRKERGGSSALGRLLCRALKCWNRWWDAANSLTGSTAHSARQLASHSVGYHNPAHLISQKIPRVKSNYHVKHYQFDQKTWMRWHQLEMARLVNWKFKKCTFDWVTQPKPVVFWWEIATILDKWVAETCWSSWVGFSNQLPKCSNRTQQKCCQCKGCWTLKIINEVTQHDDSFISRGKYRFGMCKTVVQPTDRLFLRKRGKFPRK